MVFAYGAPYIWFFVCKRGAIAAVFLFGGGFALQIYFRTQKGCLKLEIAEESQQDGINSLALAFFYFCKQQKKIIRPDLLT